MHLGRLRQFARSNFDRSISRYTAMRPKSSWDVACRTVIASHFPLYELYLLPLAAYTQAHTVLLVMAKPMRLPAVARVVLNIAVEGG